MPSGCLFCDSCGSYDHDSSMCSKTFVDGCDDVETNECEHVNFVSNANVGQRFDGPKNFGNRNSHPQGGFDNYNNGGYRNQGNKGFRGNYNNQGYSNQNPSHGKNLEEIIDNKTKIINTYMAVSDKKFNEMMTHNKMLKTQITQLANTLKDCASPSSLPSQGVEPKKPMYSITTRSGRVLNEGVFRSIEEDEERSDLREEVEKVVSKSVSHEEVQEKKRSSEKEREEVWRPDLPYPQKFLRHKN
ncbi:syntaxin-7A-like [Chenopodium quinoa]|uniref:syntaxin-7A-like n=1 Tax=Chenopodium quinoa TaxID=63459 RepID=UPI000B77456D|nr:syntaxin-7A-like [Chenopodium quinoa]